MSWRGSVNILQDEHLAGLVSTGFSSISTKDIKRGSKKRPFQYTGKNEADEDDVNDELFNGLEKKRRLTTEQVNFLETSFNMDLKLEPQRKALLAKQLGIRPRQVAIWFQNRRARWKNKQLEQDYETLKASYEVVVKEKESIAKEHESALEENKRLQAEVTRLTSLIQSSENGSSSDAVGAVSSESWPVKDEQLSDKSGLTSPTELMSPTKSVVDQSEVQDSGQSYPTLSDEDKVIMAGPLCEELNSAYGVKLEVAFPSSDNRFGSLPLLVQQLVANGYCLEDAYNIFFECEDRFGGLAWCNDGP